MTGGTGQYPKKRETEEQEKKRNDRINEKIFESGNPDYRDKYKPKDSPGQADKASK